MSTLTPIEQLRRDRLQLAAAERLEAQLLENGMPSDQAALARQVALGEDANLAQEVYACLQTVAGPGPMGADGKRPLRQVVTLARWAPGAPIPPNGNGSRSRTIAEMMADATQYAADADRHGAEVADAHWAHIGMFR